MSKLFGAGFIFSAAAAVAAAAEITITGDWQVRVTEGLAKATLTVDPPEITAVTDEAVQNIPFFNPQTPDWARGRKLAGVWAQDLSVTGALVGDSLVMRRTPGGTPLDKERDYDVDVFWGSIGRREGGALSEGDNVVVSYSYGKRRLDAVVQTGDRKIILRKGTSHVCTPEPPALQPGETRLANIWVKNLSPRLTDDLVFPVTETAFPEPPATQPSAAERLLPKTVAKLASGEPLRILAWGDSVTEAGYLPAGDRWQTQFTERLRERFPKAKVELITEAWGGRTSANYLDAPPDSGHNYQAKVLDVKPDLIISEFVNDANVLYEPAAFNKVYSRIRSDFNAIGAEWVILTPHYIRTDWMGLKSERDCDDDPRPYVRHTRAFAAENNVALADAALRYGRLWRQGIPYSTLMVNNINHPNRLGMTIFADALIALFGEPAAAASKSGLRPLPGTQGAAKPAAATGAENKSIKLTPLKNQGGQPPAKRKD